MSESITVRELERRKRAHETFVLLDVREHEEREICHISGDIHIPLGQLLERIAELPKNKDVIVYCHSGGRSAFAATYLREHGIHAFSLLGGIDTWAEEIEPDMERY